jgi:hypothetical protein
VAIVTDALQCLHHVRQRDEKGALEMPKARDKKLQCDFCGAETERVRRVALDQGYDRLGQRHAVRYACDECSSRKEAERARPVDSSGEPL